jgi:hypothetical protein
LYFIYILYAASLYALHITVSGLASGRATIVLRTIEHACAEEPDLSKPAKGYIEDKCFLATVKRNRR